MTTTATAREQALTINPAGIHRDLKRRKRWILWRSDIIKGKPQKVPYSLVTGRRYTGKKSELATFDDVHAAYLTDQQWDGIAFAITPKMELIFIDLDRCVIDGIIADWAQEIVDRLKTYTEYSVSGTGLKLVVAGKKPRDWTRLKLSGRKIEVFDNKSRILTGNRLPGTPNQITPNQAALNWLFVNSEEMSGRRQGGTDEMMEFIPSRYDDENVLASIKKNDPRGLFQRAYFNGAISHWKSGNHEEDWSAADFYCCCRILWHNGGNLTQAEALWAQSPLANRDKFKRQDYRTMTLNNALAQVLGEGPLRGQKVGDDGTLEQTIQSILRAAIK